MTSNTLTSILASVIATVLSTVILGPKSMPLALGVAAMCVLLIAGRKSLNREIILLFLLIVVVAGGLFLSTNLVASPDPISLAATATATAQWQDPAHAALTATAYQAAIDNSVQLTLAARSR